MYDFNLIFFFGKYFILSLRPLERFGLPPSDRLGHRVVVSISLTSTTMGKAWLGPWGCSRKGEGIFKMCSQSCSCPAQAEGGQKCQTRAAPLTQGTFLPRCSLAHAHAPLLIMQAAAGLFYHSDSTGVILTRRR